MLAASHALGQIDDVPGLIDLLLETEAVGMRILAPGETSDAPPGVIRVLAHRTGVVPNDIGDADIALTTDPAASAPWVQVDDIDAELARLASLFAAQPIAASVAAQVFRTGQRLDFASAILVESLAYSMLLTSAGFADWRKANAASRSRADTGPAVVVEREAGALVITLNHPKARNAMTAEMRDALCDALAFAEADPHAAPVILRGRGASFSTGGDLAEFGTASDVAAAHLIRTLRSAATILHRIAGRSTAILHGPCIGSGLEIPLAAARVLARPGTRFRLPEVGMGLIPGAGGTVTLARRIGRQRACWMAVGGGELDCATALRWGLIDGIQQ